MNGKHALPKPTRASRLGSKIRLRTAAIAVTLMSLTTVTAVGSTASFTDLQQVPNNSFSAGTLSPSATVSSATGGPGLFNLSWTQSASTYAAGYSIERATDAAGPWTTVGTVQGRTTTTFVDGVPSNNQWYYRINTVFNNWISASAAHTAQAVQLHPVGIWGRGTTGEIGNDAFDNKTESTAMLGPAGKNLTYITGGLGFSCGLFAGEAWCWGDNRYGQLGDGTSTTTARAVRVAAGAMPAGAITKISGGNGHTCALTGGKAYCWGLGTSGQLVDGNLTSSNTPVLVGGLLAGKNVTDISVGNGHVCVVADSAAYCWGLNTYGKLGTGNTTNSASPVKVTDSGVLSGKVVTSVSAGGYHSCAIASGKGYCWGYGTSGQLGQGARTDSLVPVAVSAEMTGTVSGLSAGYYSTCGLAAGVPYCWGNGPDGNLGNGGTADSSVPVKVTTTGVLSGRTVTSISSGYNHVCVRASGKVSCWGGNTYGQVGDGTVLSRSVPVDSIVPPTSAMDTGFYNTFVVLP